MMLSHTRRERTRALSVTVFAAATILMTACKLDFTGVAGGPTELGKISLTGPSTVQVGDTIRLTASGSVTGLLGLLLIDQIRDGSFTVSDATVAAIVPFNPPLGDTTSFASVRVQGLKSGRVEVTVRARGKRDTHPIEITLPGA